MDTETKSRSSSSEKVHESKESHSAVGHSNLESHDWDPEFEKKTIRQVDWRMLPLLGVLYAISLIDRTNTGIARTAGMEQELRLDIGERYSIALCMYFVPYILFQLPSNLLLRRLGVRNWITFLVVAWGAAELGMGFVTNWQGLTACRALLGLFEAGYFPAMVFVITTWYKRHETQSRLSIFYVSSLFITGFSPILAYGLTQMHGLGGQSGWRWIFIMEGIMTILGGIAAWLFLPDFPDKNKFLTEEQTRMVLERIEKDRGDATPDEITKEKVIKHSADWTSWAYGLMFMSSTMPAYAITYFITTLLTGMGFNVRDALLLSAPPFVWSAIWGLSMGFASDRFRSRGIFVLINSFTVMLGLLITCYAPSNAARYAGLFVANGGATGGITGTLAFSANNVCSHSKRAVSTAIIIAFGGIGGIFGTTVYRQQDFPHYRPGLWATIACQIMTVGLTFTLMAVYRKRNKKADETGAVLEGTPGFRYIL